jgi:hypothetical protein
MRRMKEAQDSTENAKQRETPGSKEVGRGWLIVTLVVFNLSASFLRTSLGFSLPTSLLIAGSIVFSFVYWIPPRPETSFWRFALGVAYFFAGASSAIWYIPDSIAHIVPFWIACGLPVFVYSISLYGVSRWFPAFRKRQTSFKKWLLGSFIATIVIVFFRLI